MKIAVLGWGSLIPHPTKNNVTLQIRGHWKRDGPYLPVEYARISDNGELTLVIKPGSNIVRTLWAYSRFDNLYRATRNLRKREGIPVKATKRIGYVLSYGNSYNSNVIPDIHMMMRKWTQHKGMDAVIWTDLPENFMKNRGKPFSETEAINYLRTLTGPVRDSAKKYVQETPHQINTHLRPKIEQELGL